MDFDLTEEQQMLRESAEQVMLDGYQLNTRRELLSTPEGFSPGLWRRYADLGWLGVALPEDVGGLGCSIVEVCLLMEALGKGMALEPYLATAVLAAQLIDRSGSETHRLELLPSLVEGKLLLALAHYEPGRRYEQCPVQTTARQQGNGWVIDGSKQLVVGASTAGKLIVSARREGEEGFDLFLVDARTPGVRSWPYELIDGTRASDLTFQRVEIPGSARLAASDRAAALLEEVLDLATLATIAEALGAMESALTLTSDYLKGRRQFGQPIGKFQVLQHRMAEMFVETQRTRSMLYQGLANVNQPAAIRRRSTSFAKAIAGEAALFVGGNGIQLHGGYGMTEEYQVSHVYKKLVVFEKSFGDTDWHLQRIARN